MKENTQNKYFKCRFFKGSALTSKIFKAADELEAEKLFKRKFPSKHLLEVVELITNN